MNLLHLWAFLFFEFTFFNFYDVKILKIKIESFSILDHIKKKLNHIPLLNNLLNFRSAVYIPQPQTKHYTSPSVCPNAPI